MKKEYLVLEHQLEEWKYLNEYVNNMDFSCRIFIYELPI